MVDGASPLRNFMSVTLPNSIRCCSSPSCCASWTISASSTRSSCSPVAARQFDEDPAGLPLRGIVQVLQTRPGRRNRAHPAGRHHHPGPAVGADLRPPANEEGVSHGIARRHPVRDAPFQGPSRWFSVFLAFYLVWTVLPIFIMFVSSFKDLLEAFKLAGGRGLGRGDAVLRVHAHLQALRELFANLGFSTYLFNSLVAAGGSALVSVVLGSMCAYSLSRIDFRGKKDCSSGSFPPAWRLWWR
jgi:hypothetical protein